MTWARISERGFNEGPVMMTHCNEHFTRGADWTKGDTPQLLMLLR